MSRARTERAGELGSNHDLLSAILEGTKDAIFVKDEHGRYQLVNSAAARVIGRPVEQILGHDDADLFPANVARELMAMDRRVLAMGEAMIVEEEVEQPGELRRTFLSTKFPHRDGRGEIVGGVIGIARDITQRKQAERATDRSKKLLEAIHRVQSHYIAGGDVRAFFADLLGVLLHVTDSEYGFIGEVLTTTQGDPYLKTLSITDVAWDAATREFYEDNAPAGMEFFNLDNLFGVVMRTGRPVIANDPSSDPRGGGVPEGHPALDAFLGLPFHHGGRMVGMVGVANRPGGYDEEIARFLAPFLSTCGSLIAAHRGENRRRQAEAKLREQEAQLAHVTRLSTLGEMVAEIAHEVSQPLYSISYFAKSCTELLERGEADREVLLEWTRRINDIALQGGEMLGRFNSFVRKGAEQRSSTDLTEVIADSIELVGFEARHQAVTIRLDCPDAPVRVHVDRTRIQQVLVNLVRNACEAMKGLVEEDRQVVVRLRRAGGWVEVAVDDGGPGLPEGCSGRAFDPFFTTKPDGMGMGLPVSRTIVEEHGGELWATTSRRGGASLRFTLPLPGTREAPSPRASTAD